MSGIIAGACASTPSAKDAPTAESVAFPGGIVEGVLLRSPVHQADVQVAAQPEWPAKGFAMKLAM